VTPTLHPNSVAALKANVFYFSLIAEKAFHDHKSALIRKAEAETALNNTLTQKYFRGDSCDETSD